jgi:hypothetical protein
VEQDLFTCLVSKSNFAVGFKSDRNNLVKHVFAQIVYK